MTTRPRYHFIRHYIEMVAAMFALAMPAGWAVGAFGVSHLSPPLMVFSRWRAR